MALYLKLILVLVLPCCAICIKSGPKFPPTKGEVWPRPQYQEKNDKYHIFKSFQTTFFITKPYFSCDILEEGIKRLLYRDSARRQKFVRANQNMYDPKHDDSNKIEFKIKLTNECENYPHLDMDERYKLTVGEKVVLSSASIWGILRGMETFNHLLYYSDDYSEIRFNATTIIDYPAYKHRGLLIDTGRHYLRPEIIYSIIDSMEMNKMNVLHWHIVDDQSFPYQSEHFPSLSKKGAYDPTMVYTKEVIQRIIERGRLAGIRVIPEFDVPGHVRSWGEAIPSILTQCYENNTLVGLGPLDPINNKTYEFLQQLYKEVAGLFPDEYIHLGGDEVDTECWKSNPKIQDYVTKHNITDINLLQNQFMSKVNTLLPAKSKYILWQEVFDSGVSLPKKTILQVWKYEWIQEMDKVLAAGNRVIFSSAWYLDIIADGWEKFYEQDPRQMVFIKRLNSTGLDDILGGEACMWGEMVDETNILSRIWPRTSAVAERLWSGLNYKTSLPSVNDFIRQRIEEHTCRMRHNGIPAEPPNGPGFCIGPVSRYELARIQSRRNHGRHIHSSIKANKTHVHSSFNSDTST